jgi:hypothetical protein
VALRTELLASQKQVADLQALNGDHEHLIRALTGRIDAFEAARRDEQGQGRFGGFDPVVEGSKNGVLDKMAALELGKRLLTCESVLCMSGACQQRDENASHMLCPSLCDKVDSNKVKETKIKVGKFAAGLSVLDLPPRDDLRTAWDAALLQFRGHLRLFGSLNLLCVNFYTANDFARLFDMVNAEAQRLYVRAAQNAPATQAPRKCTGLTIVKVIDAIIKAGLDSALRRGEAFDLCDARNPVVQQEMHLLAPTLPEPHERERDRGRTKREAAGERFGEQGNRKKMTPAEQAQRNEQFLENKKKQICWNFNRNEPPCAGKETCTTGRRHVCSVCLEKHAKSLTEACKGKDDKVM